jgi:tetratricopeptide (TPR) repeat protein
MNEQFWDWFNDIKKELGNRANTFTKIFEYLDGFKRPVVIIETGCLRYDGNFRGDGQSTLLFDKYVTSNGGEVHSVDIDPEHIKLARSKVSYRVSINTEDSVAFLTRVAAQRLVPDFVYLDSFDFMEQDPFRTALHCANEFFAVRPIIRSDTLVVCDDTPSTFVTGVFPHVEMFGKGMFVAAHARAVGADMLFNEWQTGWTNMTGAAARTTDEDVDQLIGRARKHVEEGHTEAAERVYRAVIHKTRPPKSGVDRVARGEACAFYARLAASVGNYGTAADWFRDAIMADPRAVDYRLELVTKSYRPQLNWQLAEQECERSIEIEPDNPNAWRILGDVQMAICNPDKAAKCYDKEMELSPGDPHAMLDRCVIALDQADYDLVRQLATKALKTDRRPDAMHVMAMVANRTGDHEAAIKLFDEAIEAGCNNKATAHWNKSLSLHAIGRYKEGWKEHEWRREEGNNPALSIAFQRFTRPIWNYEPPPALLHIHAEAGAGDNICYARFLSEFLRRGYRVRYETHEALMTLVQRSFPDVEVVKRAADYPGAIGIKNFDYHVPLGSITYLLGTDIDTVPWDGPYLTPDPKLVKRFDLHFSRERGHKRRIGLCWSSGIREYGIWLMEYGKRKSMHYDQIVPIVDAANRQGDYLVSLQVGPERAQCRWDERIKSVLPDSPSFDETAALIENLDLVITVDTAVAHLAGAMGKPVWILMQRDGASFHFMSYRPGSLWNEASPWYPTARLFRQHQFNRPHFWGDVVSDIVEELTVAARKVA